MSNFWQKTRAVLLGAGLVAAGGLGYNWILDDDPQQVDLSKYVTKTDLQTATAGLATQDQVADLQTDLQADIVWEGTAEGLALVELQDEDYETLREFLGLGNLTDISEEDWEDLEYTVEVRDVDVRNVDADDREATVVFELRVRHNDLDGDRAPSQTVWATATIEDGEVEDLDFSPNEPH